MNLIEEWYELIGQLPHFTKEVVYPLTKKYADVQLITKAKALSDESSTLCKGRIPIGTVIALRGYVARPGGVHQFAFALVTNIQESGCGLLLDLPGVLINSKLSATQLRDERGIVFSGLTSNYFSIHTVNTPTVERGKFPHTCPNCKSAAYVGFNMIECSNTTCKRACGK